MSDPSAFPSLWRDNGSTLVLHEINRIPRVEYRVDDIACIKSNPRMRKVVVHGALHVRGTIKRRKLYEAVFTNPRIKELDVRSWDSTLFYWVSKALHEKRIEKLCMYNAPTAEQSTAKFIAEALRVKSLKEFELSCRHVSWSSGRVIAEALAKALKFPLTSLFLVHLSPNSFGHVCEPIMGALVRNKTLRKLELSGHFGYPWNEPVRVDRYAAHILEENTTIKYLFIENLSSDVSPDVGLILQSLNCNKTLKFLRLRGFSIGAGSYIIVNNTVKTLELDGSEIDLDGAKFIGGAFSRATALRRLDLSNCGLNDTMVGHICKILEESGRLEEFILGQNIIGNDGCIQISEAMCENEVLAALDISFNRRITDTGVKALIESVKAHPSIASIDINDIDVSDTVKAELEYYLDLKGPKSLLNAHPPLPLSLWPRAFKRADNCRHVSRIGTRLSGPKAPEMLYYLVKEKGDLFTSISNA